MNEESQPHKNEVTILNTKCTLVQWTMSLYNFYNIILGTSLFYLRK